MRLLFFGTSSFAAKILEFLLEKKENIVAIITRPDRPKGRSLQLAYSPVKEYVLKQHPSIPLFQPEKASTELFVEKLKHFQPELSIVVAYGEIMRENLLHCPSLGSINIHASLLPKYRGAAPIQRALMEGERETGITIIEMTAEMDAGAILEKAELPIPLEMTFGELNENLCKLACHTLFNVLQDFKDGKIRALPQDHLQKTFAPKIRAEDEKIDWNQPATRIHNQVRALSPLPGAWAYLTMGKEVRRIKIKRTYPISGVFGMPGAICRQKERLIVACGEGGLQLHEVQPEGKKAMSAEEWMRGLRGELFFN